MVTEDDARDVVALMKDSVRTPARVLMGTLIFRQTSGMSAAKP